MTGAVREALEAAYRAEPLPSMRAAREHYAAAIAAFLKSLAERPSPEMVEAAAQEDAELDTGQFAREIEAIIRAALLAIAAAVERAHAG